VNQAVEPQDNALRTAPRAVAPEGARPRVARRTEPPRGLRQIMQGAVVPYLKQQVQSVGPAGVAGVALLAFAAAFFFGANSPLKGELTQLQSTLESLQSNRASRPSTATPAPQSELNAFVKRLPARAELPALTGQIVEKATAAGIVLERGTYDFTVSHSGQLVRARLSFPVHGSYPDIRRFIDATLASVPGAAVDALRFERKNVGDAEVDADIRFAIYLRAVN